MQKPFDREHADAWSSDFADVESLNARASDLVLKAIETVRESSRREPESLRSHSLLILGPAGAGKTHLFARLRRKLGPRATFVLMRPEIAIDPTPRHVLAACLDALQRKVAGREERQLDLVVGSAISMLEGHGVKYPTVFVEELKNAAAADRAKMIERAVEKIAELHDDIDPIWLERLLAVPAASMTDRRAALAWLSGREPDLQQLERLGLREPLPDTSVLPALRTLSVIASYSTPIVLVFDQLENLVEEDDASDRKIHAHGRLLAELFDTVRGMVLVQMALDAEWQRRIRPRLSESERSRLEARVELLDLPTPAQRSALLEGWISKLSPEERHPAPWPFTAEEWLEWSSGPGVTPRMLMIACRQAYARSGDFSGEESLLPPPSPSMPPSAAPSEDVDARVAELWEETLSAAREKLAAIAADGRPLDAERLLGGLAALLRLVEDIKIQPKKSRDPHDLRVAVGPSEVDVFIAQHTHPRSAIAALQKATAAASERPVIALRERSRPFPPSWGKVSEQLSLFSSTPRGKWLELSPPEVVELIAVEDFLASARSQDLAARDGRPLREDVVRAWTKKHLEPSALRPIAALLGKDVASDEPAIVPLPSPERVSVAPRATRAAAKKPSGLVATLLEELGLASVDRLVTEARRREKDVTRAFVLRELRGLGDQVRWFGRAIVVWRGGAK